MGSCNWEFGLWKPWLRQKLWYEAEAWWWHWDWWEILGRRFQYPYLPKVPWSAQTWCKKPFCAWMELQTFLSCLSKDSSFMCLRRSLISFLFEEKGRNQLKSIAKLYRDTNTEVCPPLIEGCFSSNFLFKYKCLSRIMISVVIFNWLLKFSPSGVAFHAVSWCQLFQYLNLVLDSFYQELPFFWISNNMNFFNTYFFPLFLHYHPLWGALLYIIARNGLLL